MPVISANAPGTQALIGPPPPSIPAFAISSFLLMLASLYYVFFRFTFTYDYDGFAAIRNGSPQQVVVTMPEGQNLDGNRTSNWQATVQLLRPGTPAVLKHRFGAKSSEIKHNAFYLPYQSSLRSLPVGVPVACKIRLTSAPLIAKLL